MTHVKKNYIPKINKLHLKAGSFHIFGLIHFNL